MIALAPVRGIEKGKLLMLRSRERGGTFSGLALLTSQKWWFGCKSVGTSKGYREREKGPFFRLCLGLSKVVVLVAKVLAPVGGSKG